MREFDATPRRLQDGKAFEASTVSVMGMEALDALLVALRWGDDDRMGLALARIAAHHERMSPQFS